MTKLDRNKLKFFKQLGLMIIDCETYKTLQEEKFDSPCKKVNLLEKNNSIKTGYENFHIKKSRNEFYPFKHFDFIGKQVVCQKCFQKCSSIVSYKKHVNTKSCGKIIVKGPNPLYVKYKNKIHKQREAKQIVELKENLHNYDVKKYLFNPKMLNISYCNFVGTHSIITTKARTKKKIETLIKKPGKPIKLTESLNRNDPNFNKNIYDNDDDEPKIVIKWTTDDKYTSKVKILSDKLHELFNNEWSLPNDEDAIDRSQYRSETGNEKMSGKDKELNEYTSKMKEFYVNVRILENDLHFLLIHCREKYEKDRMVELRTLLMKLQTKRNEFYQKTKKTGMNNGKTVEIENVQQFLTIKTEPNTETADDTYVTDEHVSSYNENDNKGTVDFSGNMPVTSNHTSIVKTFAESNESTDLVGDKPPPNTKTLAEDATTNPVGDDVVSKNQVDERSHFSYDSLLSCTTCNIQFQSYVQTKMQRCGDQNNDSKKCEICGLKFQERENFVTHITQHQNANKGIKMETKIFECKICAKQFNLLVLFYAHVKVHK